jgi:hypothetical protein
VLQDATIIATQQITSNYNLGVGGIVGISNRTLKIENAILADLLLDCRVKKSGTTKEASNIGGVVGVARSGITLTNVEVYASAGKTFKVYSNNTSGSLVGVVRGASTITNCKVNTKQTQASCWSGEQEMQEELLAMCRLSTAHLKM